MEVKHSRQLNIKMTKIKNIFFNLIFAFVILSLGTPLSAEIKVRKEIQKTIRETIEQKKEASLSPKEIRKEIREQVRKKIREENQNLIDKIKNLVKKNLRYDARVKGKITSIEDSILTVLGEDGKNYKVNIISETRLIRRFGGESRLDEFSIGNEVNVFGKFIDENQTTIDAKLIRNISIQKRWGVFFGKVTVKNSDNFIIKTIERGEQTVYLGVKTKFLNHKKEVINYNDLQIGNRVRVKGIWDRSLNKITEVEEVRVFPIPPTITLSP